MRESLAPRPRNYEFPVDPPEKVRILLPVIPLVDLDLTTELYAHYIIAKQLLSESDDQPLNQKAQTLNSIVAILRDIAKTRTDLYNAERLKKLESCLLEVLKDHPALSAAFMESYELALAAI